MVLYQEVIMIKMLHLSDCGLKNLPYGGINPETGLNRRFEDIARLFEHAIKIASKEGCKYFIIAGDINEERNPDSFIVERFSSYIASLISLGIEVIIVAGNHDLDSSKSTSTSISFLKALDLYGTLIADLTPIQHEYDDVVFHCIPYMFPHQVGGKTNQDVTDYLHKYISQIKVHRSKPTVLVTHYSTDVTFAGLDVDEPVIYIDDLSKFSYVALGHIHKYEMFSSFTGGYTGSMFTKDFGEQNDKYVNVVAFDGDVKIDRVKLPERKFIQFNLDALDCTTEQLLEKFGEHIDTMGGAAQCIKDCIVKVSVKSRKRFNPKIIYDVLKRNGAFHFTPIDWKIIRDGNIKRLDKNAKTDGDIVRSYFSKHEDKDRDGKIEAYINEKITQWGNSFA